MSKRVHLRQGKPPERQFYRLTLPVPAEGKEANYLGVAFAHPTEHDGGEFTPQGPEEVDGNDQHRLDSVAGDAAATKDATSQATSSSSTAPISYDRVGVWPRSLHIEGFRELYPKKPTLVLGKEEITKRLAKVGTGVNILEMICLAVGLERSRTAELQVPYLRIWKMESPHAKIRRLLEHPEYRNRVIDLCKSQGLNAFYIATGLAIGQNMKTETAKLRGLELIANVADPTGTIPISLNNELHLIKENVLKQTYPGDQLVCMAYRIVHYKRIVSSSMREKFMSWWRWFFGASTDAKEADDPPKKMSDHGISAELVSYRDGDAIVHFVIEKFNADPKAAAFMSEPKHKSGSLQSSFHSQATADSAASDGISDNDDQSTTLEDITLIEEINENEVSEDAEEDDDEEYEDILERLLRRFDE